MSDTTQPAPLSDHQAAAAALSYDDCVDKIQAARDYMLAYADQKHDQEPAGGAGPSMRTILVELEYGLLHVTSTSRLLMAELQAPVEALQALEAFSNQLEADAERALNLLQVVLTAPVLSSRLIARLNEALHLRCLFSDVFILDEALQLHRRSAAQV